MIKVRFITHEGEETEVEAMAGTSLMRAAVDNGIPEILAECDGACSCATCHIFVDESRSNQLPEPGSMELAMVEYAVDYNPERSRLSCQIAVTDKLDGMIVHLPESQN